MLISKIILLFKVNVFLGGKIWFLYSDILVFVVDYDYEFIL